MSINDLLVTLAEKVNQHPGGIAGLEGVYQLDLTSGTYQVRFADGQAEYAREEKWQANCTLKMSDEHFIQLVEGTLTPTTAFMTGKLKIKGDLAQALKLQTVLKKYGQ